MKRSMALAVPAHARKAWRALLAATGQALGRRATLMRHEATLLPRFAAYYARLDALPRRVQRRLLRRAHLSIAGVAFLCAIGQAPAFAATITVDGTTCTLSDAIIAANTDAPSGGCAAGSGADTIVLPANTTFLFTEQYPIQTPYIGPRALPTVASSITIEGNGSTLARQAGAPQFGILGIRVSAPSQVTLNNLTVQGGGGERPGGIYGVVGGPSSVVAVTLNHCRVLNNSSGGVAVSVGTVTLNHSTVTGNTGQGVSAARVTITDTIISNNHIPLGPGGGVVAFTCTITDSAINGNSARVGGGIFADSCTITNSTISGNGATEDGGGVHLREGGSIANSTISGNSAARGGGVFADGELDVMGPLTMTDSTVANNTASVSGGGIHERLMAVSLARTIVSGNSAPAGREVHLDPASVYHFNYETYVYDSFTGNVVVNDFNLIGHDGDAGTDGLPLAVGPTDVVPAQPLASILGPLAANGGPTMTHALVPDSPALDVVPTAGCAATDQRGVSRPQGPRCDVGAFEREPSDGFVFNGFFAPVSKQALNTVKAGQGIPVRFSLGGNRGLNIFEGGYPATQQAACDLSSGTSAVTETTNAGNSGLSYDAASDTYTFVWKTDKGWSNSCRRLLLRFTDGSTVDAEFRFTK